MFLCRSAIKRNAWCAPVCLGLHKKPHFAHFTNKAIEGGMAGLVTEEREDTSEFQCFPLARYPTPSPLPGFQIFPPCQVPQIIPLTKIPKYFPLIFLPSKYPPTSILLAVGNQTVNYLSLDIEGAEIQVSLELWVEPIWTVVKAY